jgi:hypothetical protein
VGSRCPWTRKRSREPLAKQESWQLAAASLWITISRRLLTRAVRVAAVAPRAPSQVSRPWQAWEAEAPGGVAERAVSQLEAAV